MLDPERQEEVLRQVATAAAKRGLAIAPVGSVYFLLVGKPKTSTKDVDTVVHSSGQDVASFEALLEIAREIGGRVTPGEDRSSVQVGVIRDGVEVGVIDLLRGREGARGGFLPRSLLREAASRGRRVGSIVTYPLEYVIVLKADAAVDREDRSAGKGVAAETNRQRAEIFKADVFTLVADAMRAGSLDEPFLRDAIGH